MSAANEDTSASSTPQFVGLLLRSLSTAFIPCPAQTDSTSGLQLTALVTGAIVVGALSFVWLILHKKYKRVYESRVVLAHDEYVQSLPS
jgi:hypothetical protein